MFLNTQKIKIIKAIVGLTVTKVVFEWSKLEDEKRKLKWLTVTKVVFEYGKLKICEKQV